MEQIWKTIYEVIDEKYFDENEVKFHKYFLTECKSELNVPQFVPLKIKKNIQQVGLEDGLLSQIVRIKRELVVVVQY